MRDSVDYIRFITYHYQKTNYMKKLKLLLLTLLSVLSFNLFSQIQVNTTSTSGPNVCDGMAALDSSNVATISNIVWQGMGAIINQGSYFVNFFIIKRNVVAGESGFFCIIRSRSYSYEGKEEEVVNNYFGSCVYIKISFVDRLVMYE